MKHPLNFLRTPLLTVAMNRSCLATS